jgi:glycosyltransferase involved in cell wall biosynthesis
MATTMHEMRSVVPVEGQVVVAVPAYNEDRFIGSVVLKLRGDGFGVLVVDDGSMDRTAEVAESAGARVVRHGGNRGKTAAVETAFEEVRKMNASALVLLDGDSQHDPADVRRLVAPVLAGQADMVVGSRFIGARSTIPRWRVAGQHALTLATNYGSGLHLTDTESGFSAFSRRAIDEMRFRGRGFSLEPAMQFEAKQRGWKVLELPIQVHYAVAIKRNPVKQGMHTMDAIFRLIAEHRPLLYFGVPGAVVFLAGLLLGLNVVRIYDATLQLAVGMALITVLLCILGVLTIFTGIVLHAMRMIFLQQSRRP